MLVLTRKQQEKIRIGDGITITVLRTKGKAVRLGIEAPAEVPVIRGELVFQTGGRAAGGQEASVLAATAADDVPTIASTGRNNSDWSVKSAPAVISDRLPGETAPRVSFERVARAQIAQVLPQLPSSEGPLRAMLNRRSLTA
jgi:carbon storage regulator